jgi:hypothetical protein
VDKTGVSAATPFQSGFGTRGMLNSPALRATVLEFSTRYFGTTWYSHGKLFDINASSSGATSGMGRLNYDPFAWNLGAGQPSVCGSDVSGYCPVFYSSDGLTPNFAGLPSRWNTYAPAFARQSGWQTAYINNTVFIYKQEGNYGTGAGQFAFDTNFDLRGIGTVPNSGIWLKTKIRFTGEPNPYVGGQGRIEVWVGTVEAGRTDGNMLKVMNLIGDDPANASFGKVCVTSDATSGLDTDADLGFTTDLNQAAGSTFHDWGLLRTWSHDRLPL